MLHGNVDSNSEITINGPSYQMMLVVLLALTWRTAVNDYGYVFMAEEPMIRGKVSDSKAKVIPMRYLDMAPR